jgi:hypothetical protein
MGLAMGYKSNFAKVFQRHGFVLPPQQKNGIGATVGTACHKAVGDFLQARLDGYSIDPQQVGVTEFQRLNDGNIEFDKLVTKDAPSAETQIRRMVAEYIPHALTLKPARIECALETQVDSKYLLTGHPDLLESTGAIRDFKFGRTVSPYEAQLGAYSLMARSHGIEINKLFVDHVARSTVNKPQKPLEVIEYKQHIAENAAHYTIEAAVTQLEKFTETGNPWAFPANPSTMLCSKKWCSAWGTAFCDLGRPEKSEE